MKRALCAVAIVLALTGTSVAQGRNVVATWDPPTTLADPDCGSGSQPIPQDLVPLLQYQIQYTLGAGQPVTATTSGTTYTIESVPYGTVVSVRVGAFLPGQQVQCWTEWVSATVGYPPVGSCSSLRLTVGE